MTDANGTRNTMDNTANSKTVLPQSVRHPSSALTPLLAFRRPARPHDIYRQMQPLQQVRPPTKQTAKQTAKQAGRQLAEQTDTRQGKKGASLQTRQQPPQHRCEAENQPLRQPKQALDAAAAIAAQVKRPPPLPAARSLGFIQTPGKRQHR
ncbi:MAG: hypothetical protein AAFO06_02325 [Cyanobacteria bacterium J06597_16]